MKIKQKKWFLLIGIVLFISIGYVLYDYNSYQYEMIHQFDFEKGSMKGDICLNQYGYKGLVDSNSSCIDPKGGEPCFIGEGVRGHVVISKEEKGRKNWKCSSNS